MVFLLKTFYNRRKYVTANRIDGFDGAVAMTISWKMKDAWIQDENIKWFSPDDR